MIFKNDSSASELNGFLDRGSHIEGELRFDTSFRVDGKVTGTVTSRGILIVGESGEIDGKAEVDEVFVSGTVRGAVTARKRIHVAAGGRVYADLSTPALVIEDGAFFEGSCSMDRQPRQDPTPDQTADRGPKLVSKAAQS
ncbi:MAG: polymer-forming cytoskeletal protein [Acidobacteriota bacterium]